MAFPARQKSETNDCAAYTHDSSMPKGVESLSLFNEAAGMLRSMVKSERPAVIVSLLLGMLIMVCFWPVTHHAFINFDDPDYITQNPHIQAGLTWSTVKWAFTTFHAGNWHPVTWLSHALDCQIFGLNASRHHFTNALLHSLNTVALFLFLRNVTGALWRSALVAALFGLHPMHVESVAWVSERKDVLSTFFFLLTLWTYCRYVEARTQNSKLEIQNYILCLFLFALGLMSKPILVTTPFVLLLLDIWPLRRSKAPTLRLVVEKLPFLALSIVGSVVTILGQKQSGYVASAETVPLSARLANAAISYVAYVKNLLWPVDLAVYYPYRADMPPELGFAAAFLVVLLTIGALALWRTRPYVPVGWLWFLGMLVPVIGLLQVGLQSMADRYTYISYVGLFIAIVWLCGDLVSAVSNSRSVRVLTVPRSVVSWSPGLLSATALIACTVLTEVQLSYWKDNETLYRHTLKVAPDNPLIIGNLGCALVEAGRYKEATEYLEEALKRKPGFAEAELCWGIALLMQGQTRDAISHYTRAVELNPESAYAANDLAWLLATAPDPNLRDGPRAIVLAERACDLTTYSNPLLIGTLAAAYAEAGRFEEAVRTAKRAEHMAATMGDKKLAERNAELCALYEQHQAYREQPKIP